MPNTTTIHLIVSSHVAESPNSLTTDSYPHKPTSHNPVTRPRLPSSLHDRPHCLRPLRRQVKALEKHEPASQVGTVCFDGGCLGGYDRRGYQRERINVRYRTFRLEEVVKLRYSDSPSSIVKLRKRTRYWVMAA